MKQVITTNPILICPDPNKQYFLFTDSCKHTCSGILIQYSKQTKDDGSKIKLLLPKLWYMGDKKCKIHLDAVWEIYMMAVLNFKMARDKNLPPIRDPSKTDFKIGDILLKTTLQKILSALNINQAL